MEQKKNEGTYLDPKRGKMTPAEFWDYFTRTSGSSLAESTQAQAASKSARRGRS